MNKPTNQLKKHIDVLVRVFGVFQPDPEVVEHRTDLKDDSFLAWKRIQENATRRNKEYRDLLDGKLTEIIKSHAKDSWFKPAVPTSRDFDNALMPFNPGLVLFPKPFTFSGAVKWALSSKPHNKPDALIIKSELHPYVFYKIFQNLMIAVNEHDAFSPVQIWHYNQVKFESTSFMSVNKKSDGWHSYKPYILAGYDAPPGHPLCVAVETGSLSMGLNLQLELGSSTHGIGDGKFDNATANLALVLNSLAQALGRKAVRALNLLKPAFGELRPSRNGYNKHYPLLKKYKNVDPFKHYCDLTPREYEDQFTTREPVKVFE